MRTRGAVLAAIGYGLVVPGVWRNCRLFGPVRMGYGEIGRRVCLTIDDGPDPRQTPMILDTLAEHGVRAVFFVIGRWVQAHPHLCRRMVEEGHLVENHTWSHASATFWAAGWRRALDEIRRCSEAIADATGSPPRRFRAPVGMANPFVHLAAGHLGLETIGWSASGNDGLPHHRRRVVARITRAASPGGIVLLHGNSLSGMAEGARACTLEDVVDSLGANGFDFWIPGGADGARP